jgi:hypothetical protein
MAAVVPGLFRAPPGQDVVDREVASAGSVIRIAGFAALDWEGCPVRLGAVAPALLRGLSPRVVRSICEALAQRGEREGLAGILRDREGATPLVTHARRLLDSGRPEELVGYGPGLTPAGDDFLTGAILATPGASFVDAARLTPLLPGTTPAGRTLLYAALRGQFPAYLVDFITAVAAHGDSIRRIESSVRRACSHGETSGSDALSGICWARHVSFFASRGAGAYVMP